MLEDVKKARDLYYQNEFKNKYKEQLQAIKNITISFKGMLVYFETSGPEFGFNILKIFLLFPKVAKIVNHIFTIDYLISKRNKVQKAINNLQMKQQKLYKNTRELPLFQRQEQFNKINNQLSIAKNNLLRLIQLVIEKNNSLKACCKKSC